MVLCMSTSVKLLVPTEMVPTPGSVQPSAMAMMQEDMEVLAREAECSVCFETPRGIVNQCRNGHLLCHSCETQMRNRNRGHMFNCPQCRFPFTPSRNLFVARLVFSFQKN